MRSCKLVKLLLGILLSPALADSSTVESRKRKRKEISCYPLAGVKLTILTLVVVSLSRYNLDPEGSWICEVRRKSRESREAAETVKQTVSQ